MPHLLSIHNLPSHGNFAAVALEMLVSLGWLGNVKTLSPIDRAADKVSQMWGYSFLFHTDPYALVVQIHSWSMETKPSISGQR